MYNIAELPGSIRAQINAAGLPMKTVGWQFDDLEPSESLDKVRDWVELVRSGKVIQAAGERTCGLGLMLVGEPGHGKTTLASVALQELLMTMPKVGWGVPDLTPKRPGMFMDYPKLLRLQKAQWSEFDDVTETMINGIYGEASKENVVRTFVLDDLGKEYRTANGWAENTFDALLRARFNAGLPTIVTTNVPLKNWGTVYGEPMGSFAREAFIPLAIIAKQGDRRR
jgi:DNA replication protein DnaC